MTSPTLCDSSRRAASACSRPPEPTTSTFLGLGMVASYHFQRPAVACSLVGPSSSAVAAPVVLHLVRPYANADEYLKSEAWSIDTRSMVLVEQGELPAETEIVFDVTLADGSKPIRAEAKVIGPAPPSPGRPGGLRVRFKRYGAATRAFVERAVSARWSAGETPGVTPEPPSVQLGPESMRPPPSSVGPPPPTSAHPPVRGSIAAPTSPSSAPERPNAVPAWEEDQTSRFTRAVALAAPMTHKNQDVAAPPERDALLERLRKRAKETNGSGG
jgi:hypothetical protein